MAPCIRQGAARNFTLCLLLCMLLGLTSAVTLPRFTVEPASQVVRHQAKVVLRCHTEPPSNITWLYHGDLVTSDADIGVLLEGGTLHIASFRHRRRDENHDGDYQCVSTSTSGVMMSRVAQLTAASMEQFTDEIGERTITVTEGNVALIPCRPPLSNPPADILYERSGETIDTQASGRHLVLPSGGLQIAGVKPTDEGVYRCVAHNAVTKQKKVAPYSVHLEVVAPLVNTAPRYVAPPDESIMVLAGGNLTLECVVEGAPVPVVTWNKYGGRLPDGRFRQVFGNLVIYNVKIQDEGTYICQAENGQGQPQAKIAQVEVREKPTIQVPPRSISSPEGSTVSFTCIHRGRPRVRTKWYFNGVRLETGPGLLVTATNLTIVDIQPIRMGIYQCVAINRVGMAIANALLKVTPQGQPVAEVKEDYSNAGMQDIEPHSLVHQPAIQLVPSNTTTALGSNASFTCMTSEPLSARLTWYHNGLAVPSVAYSPEEASKRGEHVWPSRYLLHTNGTLIVLHVESSDEGLYRCSAVNAGGEDQAEAYLTVSDVPTVAPRSKATRTTPSLRPSRPRADRNRHRDRGRPRNRGRNSRDGPRPDSGNPEEDMEPPSSPSVSKVSDTAVLLTWTVQENNGLSITFFKIQYKEIVRTSKTRWKTLDQDIPSANRRYEVHDLQPGGTYRFRVLAVYSNDDNKQGPNSAKFTLSGSQLPGSVPTIVEARSDSVSTMHITWQYKGEDYTPITGFLILYKIFDSPVDYKETQVMGNRLREFTLTGLQPDTFYSMVMRCLSDAGEGLDSVIVTEKTLSFADRPNMRTTTLPYLLPPHATKDFGKGTEAEDGEMEKKPGYSNNSLSTKSSSELLYMVLGIVLGVMMLLLVIFMVMCAWKQRQQRRMMAALEGRHKFHNPSQTIYVDSVRKQQQQQSNGGSAFLLNGLNNIHSPTATHPNTNGFIPNYETIPNGVPDTSLGSSHFMNINVNPMEEGSHMGDEMQGSLQEILDQPPPPPPPLIHPALGALTSDYGPSLYASLPRSSKADSSPYRPPGYASIQRPPHKSHHTSFHGSSGSYDHHRLSPDHIPRSHERLPYRSHDAGVGHMMSEAGFDEARSEHSQGSCYTQQKLARLPGVIECVRDQCTNTDASSNDGTMESRLRYPHQQHLEHRTQLPDECITEQDSMLGSAPSSRSASPPPYPFTSDDENDDLHYNLHSHHHMMLDRAQDYSASEHEDLDG